MKEVFKTNENKAEKEHIVKALELDNISLRSECSDLDKVYKHDTMCI